MTHREFMRASAKLLDGGLFGPKAALRLICLRKIVRATPFYARRRVWRQVLAFAEAMSEPSEPGMTLPADVGQTVYILLDDYGMEDDEDPISAEPITEVSTRGFWLSGFVGDPDDMTTFVPWERVGVDVFFTREAAERAWKERM